MRKFGKYLREVSVVIIGVTLTLIATNWMGSRGEKKDLQLYLNAVKLELEDNLRLLQKAEDYFNLTYGLGNYLVSTKVEDLAVDSLLQYRYILEIYYFFTYKSGAFDMLKTSGAMRLISDKELMLDIWNSYSAIESYKGEHDHYMNMKNSEVHSSFLNDPFLYDIISESKNVATVELVMQPRNGRIRNFFMTYSNVGDLQNCIRQVKQTLTRFN